MNDSVATPVLDRSGSAVDPSATSYSVLDTDIGTALLLRVEPVGHAASPSAGFDADLTADLPLLTTALSVGEGQSQFHPQEESYK